MRNHLIFLGFLALFFVVGFVVLQEALPQSKNERVYNEIKPFLPYELKQRTGGLKIVFSDGREDLTPKNAELFHITDQLDVEWGKTHLVLDGFTLSILDDNNKTIKKLELTNREKEWTIRFFEL